MQRRTAPYRCPKCNSPVNEIISGLPPQQMIQGMCSKPGCDYLSGFQTYEGDPPVEPAAK